MFGVFGVFGGVYVLSVCLWFCMYIDLWRVRICASVNTRQVGYRQAAHNEHRHALHPTQAQHCMSVWQRVCVSVDVHA